MDIQLAVLLILSFLLGVVVSTPLVYSLTKKKLERGNHWEEETTRDSKSISFPVDHVADAGPREDVEVREGSGYQPWTPEHDVDDFSTEFQDALAVGIREIERHILRAARAGKADWLSRLVNDLEVLEDFLEGEQ